MDRTKTRVWWCNHATNWEAERSRGLVVGSNQVDNLTYRRTVGEVRRGDITVHYHKSRIAAFSRAAEDGRYYKQLPDLDGIWYGSGWRFRAEYHDLMRPLERSEFAAQLLPLRLGVKHYPIDSRGFPRRAYFFPFDVRGLELILGCVQEDIPGWLESLRAATEPFPECRPPDEIDDAPIYEGAKKHIVVNAYERDPRARMLCIQHYGTRCIVCRGDLGEHYGSIAAGLIHVHHLIPLYQIGEEYQVDPIQDLRPVCPDCHAVIHLKEPPYEIPEVKRFLRAARKGRIRRRGAQVE